MSPRPYALILTALAVLGAQTACALQVTRGPYLQLGTPTSIVVRWRTDSASDSVVWFGPAPTQLTQTAADTALTTEHVLRLGALSLDTRYYYAVGSNAGSLAGGDAGHTFGTALPPGTRRPIRIWALGDSGTGSADARAVRDAYAAFTGARRTDLWLMLGDNAYNSGTDAEYQTGLFDVYQAMLRSTVLWPTLGNHDGASADSATQSGPYYAAFSLPAAGEAGGEPSGTEAYYAFDYGNVHVVCLESYETDRAPSAAMLTWLGRDLQRPRGDWTIAFWHHPPYSKGSHDSDVEIELREMRANALPILEAGGIDVILAGHSHAYERSMLLDGHYGTSTTLTGAMRIDSGDGRPDGTGAYHKGTLGAAAHQGTVYVVNGTGARAGGGTLDHAAMFTSLAELGSLVIDVDGATLSGQFVNSSGVVRDHFTLVKPTPPPTASPTRTATAPPPTRTPTATATAISAAPRLDPIAAPLVVGGTVTLSGSNFTAGSVIMLFIAMPGGAQSAGPFVPLSRSATALVWTIPATVPLGNGFGSVVVVNTDRGFASSNAQSQLLYGAASANLPTLQAVNGVALAAADPGAPLAYVQTVLTAGATMTLTGSGFNAPLINLFTIAGAPGPLVPLSGGSSTAVRVVVPAGVATGPGALQIVNAPYAGNVMSNAVSVPIGAAIGITRVTQAGALVTVDGTGFCPSTVLNLFNRQGTGTINLGGINAAGAPRIALTSVTATRLTFSVPPGAASGPAYVQAINPPFIADSSTGGDPDGAFTLIAGG
jgi:hypothetical protein